MKPITLKKTLSRAAVCALFVAGAATITSCGGGGGGGGDAAKAPYTRRPKTMDGIVLTLDNGAQFEFIRSTGTLGAQNNGEIESGAIEYFNTKGGSQSQLYSSLASLSIYCAAPIYASGMSYTYTATNSEGGVLHLKGVGSSWASGNPTYAGFQWNMLFYPSSFVTPNVDNSTPGEIDIAVTFASNGTIVSTNTVAISVPSYSTFGQYSNDSRNLTVLMTSNIVLKAGGAVPENYNPFIPLKRPSKISPISFEGMDIAFTNGAGDATNNFTLKTTRTKTVPSPSGSGQAPTEHGSAVMFINGVQVLQNPGVQYTWQRIDGTDTGTLVITGGQDNRFDGSYTLSFLDRRTGTYQGANLPSADFSGTMFASPGTTTPKTNVSL